MMKKCFFVLAAIACCACSKGVMSSFEGKNEVVELNFSVPVAATKASGAVAENEVESLQIFVFGTDGQVQSSGKAGSNSLTLTCTTGEKRIAAVVNAPALDGIDNIAELQACMSDFSDNELGRFVMQGFETKTLQSSGPVEISVSRLVSKVTLSSVTRSFKLTQHQNMDFEVLSVFLTNVPEQIGYYNDLQSYALINEAETDMDVIVSSGDMLYEDLGQVAISQGATEEFGNFLYCYPNQLNDFAKSAYLVAQTRLGDTIYYYSVKIPGMESNKRYSVSLTVTMPGSLTPDVPVQKEDAVFSVIVSDWDENIEVNETI